MTGQIEMGAHHGIHLMAYWASWRLVGGNDPLGRLILRSDVRAVVWLTTWHLTRAAGAAMITIATVAMAAFALNRLRLSRPLRRSSRRHSSPH